jgi:peptide deformylase
MSSLKSKYPLVIGQNELALRTKCTPIETITPTVRKLAKAMSELVHEYDGVWLAAPQLGYTIRLIATTQWKIIKWDYKLKATTMMVNPEVTAHSDSTQIDEEWCLSLPWIFWQVERHKQITVQYTTLEGKLESKQLSWLDAVIIQHEIDHLNGVLFIDKATDIRHE